MPFYVAPDQLIKDRADFARKGIARGRPAAVLGSADGIVLATENPSRALHKISEIYDRIAFAAVGKYNEFESLRVAGIRYADLRGYSYDRVDVTARGLANAYAQTISSVFTTEAKPLEVELVVAEVADRQDADRIYRLTFDGSIDEAPGFVVIGGQSDRIGAALAEQWQPGMDLSAATRLAIVAVTSHDGQAAIDPKAVLDTAGIEIAVLGRGAPRRAFRRLAGAALADVLQRSDR